MLVEIARDGRMKFKDDFYGHKHIPSLIWWSFFLFQPMFNVALVYVRKVECTTITSQRCSSLPFISFIFSFTIYYSHYGAVCFIPAFHQTPIGWVIFRHKIDARYVRVFEDTKEPTLMGCVPIHIKILTWQLYDIWGYKRNLGLLQASMNKFTKPLKILAPKFWKHLRYDATI